MFASSWSVEVVWERMGIGELGCTNTLLPPKTAYCYEGCGPESKAWQHCLYNTLFLIFWYLQKMIRSPKTLYSSLE